MTKMLEWRWIEEDTKWTTAKGDDGEPGDYEVQWFQDGCWGAIFISGETDDQGSEFADTIGGNYDNAEDAKLACEIHMQLQELPEAHSMRWELQGDGSFASGNWTVKRAYTPANPTIAWGAWYAPEEGEGLYLGQFINADTAKYAVLTHILRPLVDA